MITNPTERFSDRVENYKKFRPSYPAELISRLMDLYNNPTATIVADIGSGTGIFTEHLLRNHFQVYAVEPNQGMREAAEEALGWYPNFQSLNGSAESTGIADNSIDLITAAQAFHWFNLEKARVEFARILKPGGKIALIWNRRNIDTTPFEREYERLLFDQCPEYRISPHRDESQSREKVDQCIDPGQAIVDIFQNRQYLTKEGFLGRVFSSSYTLKPADPNFGSFKQTLEDLFDRYQQDGHITFGYKTHLFYGPLKQ